ncbi:MAG: phosphate/phosphite/phosphonate ABC transporter substrate-binding protein [Desulfobulbaceae bacterium]|nr:phosphate/phosphite/phosphonate ABC transporter substrate-binding protein [Desulfobulbaceae bacterium]
MNRTVSIIGALCAAIILNIGFVGNAHADLKIGVLAKRGAPEAMKKWGATGAYLSAKMGEQVAIIPLKFTDIEPAVVNKQIDFMLANSAFYVEMEKKHKVRAIATMINSNKGTALKEFGGVIFVRADSPIQTLADIKGKKFMCVQRSSFGGAHMAQHLLLENGIDVTKDTAAYIEGGKHDNVVLAVKNGSVDVGTVRSDTLERMQDEGKIKMSDFRVLNQVKDSFPFAHSTRLYPEWPMAALASTDKGKADKLAAALTAMGKDDPAAQASKVVGWSAPADYSPVTKCLRAIKYGVFAGE